MIAPALLSDKGLKLKSCGQLVKVLQTINRAEDENIFDEFFDKKSRKAVSSALDSLEKAISKKISELHEAERRTIRISDAGIDAMAARAMAMETGWDHA